MKPHCLSISLCVLACSTTTQVTITGKCQLPSLALSVLPVSRSFPGTLILKQCAKRHSDFITRWISLLKFIWEKVYERKGESLGGKLLTLSRRLLSNDSITSCEGHSSIHCRGRVFVKRLNHPSPEVPRLTLVNGKTLTGKSLWIT